MLVAIRDKLAKLKQQGRSLDEAIAAKPTVAFDAKWGQFVITPALFTRLVYHGVCAIRLGTHRPKQFERGRLMPGERLLVHGGTSGIGTTAIQFARALGARVFATASSSDKCAVCRQLGAERAINYRQEDFVSAVKEATGGNGVDVILDMIGGSYAERNQQALAVEGRLVQIGIMEGSKITLDLFQMMVRRQTITGSTLRARSLTSTDG